MRKVAIVGVGLIGGSFGLALRKAGFPGSIVGVSSPRSLEPALERGAIDRGATLEEAASTADLVFLSQPISGILETLRKLGPMVRRDTLVTDAGSTKQAIAEEARRSLTTGSFLGGHPMAGKESRGAGAADAELFRGRPWVLSEDLDHPTARVGCGRTDASLGQGRAVVYRQMAALVHHDERHGGADRVELGSGGAALLLELRIVVVEADGHAVFADGGRAGDEVAHHLLQLGNRADLAIRWRQQIGRYRLQAHAAEMAVAVHKAGQQGLAVQVNLAGMGAGLFQGRSPAACQRDAAVCDDQRLHGLWLVAGHGEDGSTEINGVRRCGVGAGDAERKQAGGGENFHGGSSRCMLECAEFSKGCPLAYPPL